MFDTVFSLVASYSVADVTSLVANELPLDTSAVLKEAQSTSKLIVDSAVKVDNLEHLVFLNSSGSVISMADILDLEKRPADVTFVNFRWIVGSSERQSCPFYFE